MEPKAPARPLRVPRRTPRACKQCRAAKIKCSSTAPCERCVRRGDTCVFPPDEPHVSIPESYLKHLERLVSSAKSLSTDTTHGANSPATNNVSSQQRRPAETQGNELSPDDTNARQPPDTTQQVPPLQQQTTPPASQRGDGPAPAVATSSGNAGGACINVITARDDVEPRLQPGTPAPSQPDINPLSGASSFLPSRMLVDSAPPSRGVAQENVQNNLDITSPHNPLISRRLSYICDTKGRPSEVSDFFVLIPSTNLDWSFCRRALALLEGHTPSPGGPHATAPLNLDGTAFRLKWTAKSSIQPSDLADLPAADYALYLYSSVKFHLGELSGMVDDLSFSELLHRFHTDQEGTATANRLWFVQYLLIIAFGKAFLEHSSVGAAPDQGPPGSKYAARAMSLMPDAAQMHDEGLPAIEALTLGALYFQAIDMRVAAYQYIGQAIRLSHVEGIYRQIDDDADAINAPFATRCNSLWWTVYILDKEMSSSQGVFNSLPEEDITAALPSERSSSLAAKALSLRIHLAKVRGSTYTSVYSVESAGYLGETFIKGTKSILHQLADVSRKLDDTMSKLKQSIKGDLPHMFRRLMLPYHHCIVLITRPLAMWLLINSLPPSNFSPQQLAHPIASLLQISAESATSITSLVGHMADSDMLETFLPFELEYLFSSAMLLSILGAIVPSYILDGDWRRKTMTLLDAMIRKRSAVAPLRKAELEQLEALLTAVKQHQISRNALSQHVSYPPPSPRVPQPMFPMPPASLYSHQRVGPTLAMGSSPFAENDEPEAVATSMTWDGMCGPNGDQILDLAEQFDMEDLEMNFTTME